MLVTLKTLQQITFKVEVEESDTVLELKEKIAAQKGEQYPVCFQKLITAGKVMEDSKILKDYKISEKGFIVVMLSKTGKPISSVVKEEDKAEAATASAPTPTDTAAVTALDTKSVESSAPPIVTTPSPASSTNQGGLAHAAGAATDMGFISADEYQGAITEMMAMGFARSEVEAAMRMAFNNPDRAVEFLLSGSTSSTELFSVPHSAMEESESDLPISAEGSSGSDFLSQLQAWPQFHQMRQLVQSNPSLLPELLQQLGRANPALLETIQSNQERFLSFLNTAPASDESSEESSGDGAGFPLGGGGGGVGGAGGMPAQIRVTEHEKESIDRLKALGFPEHLVIQAYFACDKNEDAAANFLLNEGVFEEEEYGA